jgi:hypothetical protein
VGALPVTVKLGTDEQPVWRTFEEATSLKVQNKAITQTLEKYLQTTFVNGKNYYVELGKQHYSEATKQVAIVVSNTVIDK